MIAAWANLTRIVVPSNEFCKNVNVPQLVSLSEVSEGSPYLITTLCKIDAKGVTPIPAPIRTACSAWKILVEGVP